MVKHVLLWYVKNASNCTFAWQFTQICGRFAVFFVVVFKRKFRSMCSPTISEVRPRHLESLGCASKSLRNEDTPLVEIGMRNPILNANWIRFLLDSSSNPVKHLNAMVLPKSVRFAGLPFFLPKNLTQHDDLFVLEYFGRLWI